MKAILALLLVVTLSACKGGGGSVVSGVPPLIPTPTPAPNPIDYSYHKCGQIQACAKVCDFHNPIATESQIRNIVCPAIYRSGTGPLCTALVEYHDEKYLPDNQSCKNEYVIDRTNPEFLLGERCRDNPCCEAICLQQIKRKPFGGNPSSGLAAKASVDNFLTHNKQDACLDAPAAYIINVFEPFFEMFPDFRPAECLP